MADPEWIGDAKMGSIACRNFWSSKSHRPELGPHDKTKETR